MKHVVLLRGINVGGINIKMVELRAALTSAGFDDVRTILATGNVVLESTLSALEVKKSVEKILSETFGYEAWVIVLDVSSLQSIIESYPFDAERNGWHPYVIFGNDADHLREVAGIADTLDPELESLAPGHRVAYWEVVRGHTTDSRVGKFMAKAKYKPTTTTRNLRTLVKMLA
ncbi:DUF1697 domain-containing protein [Rhodococcus sp. H29-C3]|uniref:DUF1697 domain-containing protein n=1 Tax=Rhodococcus sp. H29-C3 TaxID=3046307 RepID=UPI0024B87E8F|nr:DUF1697 domain-containing protein [Rhodococcus sp. H29-C3]MDJ0360915.1 DUF1697 domain-containing protein [Rhodococcus sp. H29-C3]